MLRLTLKAISKSCEGYANRMPIKKYSKYTLEDKITDVIGTNLGENEGDASPLKATATVPKNSTNYTREELKNLTKKTKLPNEKFFHDIQKSPLSTYSKFYANQFNASHNSEIVLKIIADINTRLNSNFLDSEIFLKHKKSLAKTREDGINLFCQSPSDSLMTRMQNKFPIIKPSDLYSFVINYVENMHELLKSQDNDIKGTYYSDFAKDFFKNLYEIGNNTQMFFTFNNLSEQYFIDIRPLCLYPVQLLDLPDFSSEQPLIPTKEIKGYVESKLLDFREVTFHDMGHAHVMSRQDKWLFETSNRNPIELVTEWLKNKDWYMNECERLKETNYSLYKAINIYLFDIVHDRGYQFHLQILRQQFRAIKNMENLKTKIMRGDFDTICNKSLVDHIDEARKWLLDVTDKFIAKDNIDKIEKYKKVGYTLKIYPDIENCVGIPIDVNICKNGKILVNFSSDGTTKMTSIYEIELLSLPVSDKILSDDKIKKINNWINFIQNSSDESIQLDSDANILNLPDEKVFDNAVENTEHSLKKIEIYKLERLLGLMKKNSSVKFSISKLPDIYESSEITVNQEKGNVTIETGLVFKLNQICIESKPVTTLKYINLDPHARFVSENTLRDSYIKYSNSKFQQLKPYVPLNDELELGIVDTKKHVEVAKAVSSLLSRSIDNAKDIYGGYLPPQVVERAQLEYVSPYAISNLWGKSGYRFVLSRKVNNAIREIIGTALVANSKDTLFFFTNKYNNVKYSTIKQNVDFDLSVDGKHRWFDKFDMPEIEAYKPNGCNQLANFAVERISCRGIGLGKLLISEIIKNYAIYYPKVNIQHSQPLICGKGLFQIADPSWRKYMLDIGFKLRYGAETFYLDKEWDKLLPVTMNGSIIDNKSYNRLYGIPQIYENIDLGIKNTEMDLTKRIPRVIELANSGDAKLQYFQLIYMFNEL